MIDAARLIFIRLHQKHLKTIDWTNMKRIWTLFGWYTYNNQPEISRIQTTRWNAMVRARICVLMLLLSITLISHHYFCYSLDTQRRPKAPRTWRDNETKNDRDNNAIATRCSCLRYTRKEMHRMSHAWSCTGSYGMSRLLSTAAPSGMQRIPSNSSIRLEAAVVVHHRLRYSTADGINSKLHSMGLVVQGMSLVSPIALSWPYFIMLKRPNGFVPDKQSAR